MKCEDCLGWIEEYVDGELGSELTGRVRRHINSCAECAAAYKALEQEQALYASYRRDVDVTPALWAGVQARIAAEKAPRPTNRFAWLRNHIAVLLATPRLSPALAAALVILTVGLTIVVMSYLNAQKGNSGGGKIAATSNTNSGKEQGEDNKTPAPGNIAENKEKGPEKQPSEKPEKIESAPVIAGNKPAPRRRPEAKTPTPEELVRDAEQKYLSAIAILSRDVKKIRSQLDSQTLARFDDALFSIDATIAETRQAVRKNPQDPIALSYMLSAYSKKVDLLREMARDRETTREQ
ncbi:MAG TPA: zf-HC2 domain-containing protein [Blastocatellia bacterium]|nr:zf-HC2 domain-containing protein [Blastocatellia bacterium]